MIVESNEIYIKAVEQLKCPFMKEDGSGFKEGQDPGSCPCMYPRPCEREILIPTGKILMVSDSPQGPTGFAFKGSKTQ